MTITSLCDGSLTLLRWCLCARARARAWERERERVSLTLSLSSSFIPPLSQLRNDTERFVCFILLHFTRVNLALFACCSVCIYIYILIFDFAVDRRGLFPRLLWRRQKGRLAKVEPRALRSSRSRCDSENNSDHYSMALPSDNGTELQLVSADCLPLENLTLTANGSCSNGSSILNQKPPTRVKGELLHTGLHFTAHSDFICDSSHLSIFSLILFLNSFHFFTLHSSVFLCKFKFYAMVL